MPIDRKYVVFHTEDDREFAVTFPMELIHADVARALSRTEHQQVGVVYPVRAGFVHPTGTPYGNSESLSMQSHPDDRSLLVAVHTRLVREDRADDFDDNPATSLTAPRGGNTRPPVNRNKPVSKAAALRNRHRK